MCLSRCAPFLLLVRRRVTLGPTHLIHRLIEMAGDMETIQHVQSLSGLGGDDLQVGFPHVAAHKTQRFYDVRPQRLQAAPQGGLRAAAAHPQQAPAMGVDLVNDGQKVVGPQAASPMNLVHADGFDRAQFAVRQTPLHEPFHRPVHRFPTGLEDARRFPPAQPSRPAR